MKLSNFSRQLLSPVIKRLSFQRSACSSGLNSYHLATGDEMPQLNPDKLTVLNMRFCPYAQRTILCLNAKEVEYDIVNCALMTKPEWLFHLNPIGKVPVLLQKDLVVYESIVTCDYIDEVYPGRPLHFSDPAKKARDKMLAELFSAKVILPQMKIWFGWKRGQGSEERSSHWSESTQNMAPFERELSVRGTTFFGGNEQPGWLDYIIWPWFERIHSYSMVFQGEQNLAFDMQCFPLLTDWMSRMQVDPAVTPYLLDSQTHAAFVKTLVNGTPNYNMLSEEKRT